MLHICRNRRRHRVNIPYAFLQPKATRQQAVMDSGIAREILRKYISHGKLAKITPLYMWALCRSMLGQNKRPRTIPSRSTDICCSAAYPFALFRDMTSILFPRCPMTRPTHCLDNLSKRWD
jgi:hypothetical protein